MPEKLRYYKPDVGDEFIEIRDITAALRDRIFEARDQATGEGIRGRLVDCEVYCLNDVSIIRFASEKLGIVGTPHDRILLKAEGFVEPEPAE